MRVKLVIAYDGTNYHGWQIQNNGETIQGKIVEAIKSVTGQLVEVIGASRTDAGVHAYGNVAIFDIESRIPAEKFAGALNSYLPDDIRIVESSLVTDDFNPRFVKGVKTYEYRIFNAPYDLPTITGHSQYVRYDMDTELMRKAATEFVGEHDFSAFCSAGSQVKSKVRNVRSVEILSEKVDYARDAKLIRIRVTGDGFLYNMVRIMAGTLVEIGCGRRSIGDLREALKTGERTKAGRTAPAKGLTLMEIKYE
ncbi:tRNA pseudouridine(38-40) synthase TruA [Eubacterium xylanophilum]|uniref:tRNA pseudouridine(38-40) synthase TruA n=1 Tax=Eubacterium xylanophilum TaxID=39497 RepID=UPI00047C9982|nr:tRNA pseudouridine(38-40) synthase TruA [Eubacterium xylanophilum]